MSHQNRDSADLKSKSTTQNIQKVLKQVTTKTNPLPFIRKGIDSYINQRKMKKKKKLLKIHDSSEPQLTKYLFDYQSKSQAIQTKRYDEIYQSIAQIYRKQEYKKRILVSPNKVLSHEKILQFFQPYRKDIEKLRIRQNFSTAQQDGTQETPFSMAIRELGVFSQCDSPGKNKMIPLKNLNSGSRSLPKKIRQKLKPISESTIKVDPSDNGFLSVEKMNLIDGMDFRNRQNQNSCSIGLGQFTQGLKDHQGSQTKRDYQLGFQRMQQLKKCKQFRMNPQLYIRKLQNSRNIFIQSQQQQKATLPKKSQQSINSIVKFYPSLKHNLKNRIVSSNQNLSIFSYSKLNEEKQAQSKRIIGADDEMQEGFYESKEDKNENNEGYVAILASQKQMIAEKQTSASESHLMLPQKQQITNLTSPLIRNQRRKRFFQQLPFETYYYRDLIWKLNYTNQQFVQTPLEYEHRLKIFVGKGNNSSMLLGLIKRRIWFAITDKVQEANFVWTQLKILPYFKKQDAGKNLCSQKSQDKKSEQKITYLSQGGILNSKDAQQFKSYFDTYINFEQKSDQRLLNRQRNFQYRKITKTSQLRQSRLQNHFINNYVIGNKKALFNTMSNYYTLKGEDVFNYLPLTFHIKNGLQDQSWFKFLKYYYKRGKQIKHREQTEGKNNQNLKQYNSWIVKPGQNSNRGNGIQVCLTLQQIKAIVKRKQKYSDGSPKTFIIQSYIQRPLLYQRRKFDLRHYMMITCVNGLIKGYFYKDGYVRTTSTQYSLKTNCGEIHLTNDAVQKNLPDYGKYEKGNKISYDELSNYMSKNAKNKNFDFSGKIYPKMKKIATDVMRACSGGIDPQKLVNNFEVFGMDFMIDSDCNVWLIEVNSNPCLELSCPLLGSIIPRMVQNSLQLTLDTIFPPPVRYTPKGVHYYKNLEQQNRYQLVYDQRIDGLSTSAMDVLDGKMLYEEDDTFEDDGEEWQQD